MNLSSSDVRQHFCDTSFPQKVSQPSVLGTRVKKCLEGHCFPSITADIQLWGCRGCYWKDSPSAGTAERVGFYVRPLSPENVDHLQDEGNKVMTHLGVSLGFEPSSTLRLFSNRVSQFTAAMVTISSFQAGDVVDGTLLTPFPCSLELRERLGLENSCAGSGLWRLVCPGMEMLLLLHGARPLPVC